MRNYPLLTSLQPLSLKTVGADLTRATQAMTCLDFALRNHPLQEAALYRLRLEAVRQMALVDGTVLDPLHLATTLQGLRLQFPSDNPWERANIIDATNAGFTLHQALTRPTQAQRIEIASALASLRSQPEGYGPLLAGALAFHAWLDQGQARMPMRAAMGRFWVRRRLTRLTLPLTGAAALRANISFERSAWVRTFLQALTEEAIHSLDQLRALERFWRHAQANVTGQRRTSRAQEAIDVLASRPVITAAYLAADLRISTTAAHRLLNKFVEEGFAHEMTGRGAWRLYTLGGPVIETQPVELQQRALLHHR